MVDQRPSVVRDKILLEALDELTATTLAGLNIEELSYTATCRVPAGAKLHILF